VSPGQPLRVSADVVIPADELHWRVDTPGGAGGQHANRSASRVELTFDVGSSAAIPDSLRPRLLERLGPRARNGVVTVFADDSRSQWRNRQTARHRLAEILCSAMREPRQRRPTRPTVGSLQRRLESKRHRAQAKQRRRRPGGTDEE
jgi:ribosome-associated protein